MQRRRFFQIASGLVASSLGPISSTPGSAFARGESLELVDVDLRLFECELPSMGTQFTLRWYSNEAKLSESIPERVSTLLEHWVDVLSDYQQDSEAMRVCRDADNGDWTKVSDELSSVLIECDRWNQLSEGAFDASLGALTSLRRKKKTVSAARIESAKDQIGWKHLRFDFDNRRFRSECPGLRFDFGAIGKGFVADRIYEWFCEQGIERANVNASGNLRLGQSPLPRDIADRTRETVGWPIAINVVGDEELNLIKLRLSECGIATSGDQFQRLRDPADGNSKQSDSSHIVDPAVGRGIIQQQSITAIAMNASDADALATSACVHQQRGSLASWVSRLEKKLGSFELLVQTKETAQDVICFRHVLSE